LSFGVVRSWSVLAAVVVLSSLGVAQVAPPVADPASPQGKVLFNRSEDAPAVEKAAKRTGAPTGAPVTDVERSSLTFTAYDLDVHLAPAKSEIAVHAGFTVTNTGSAPLSRLVFQLSSTLHWESFGLESGGRVAPLTFGEQTIDTDADHTGKATEAVVVLPQPLAPGSSAVLTGFYTGEITLSGDRLVRIGAPAEQAAHADWDQIAADGTWLRGFGDVLWYPTAAAPVFLGDGAKLFHAVGETKLRQAKAKVHLRLSIEYVGEAPDAAFFCGQREHFKAVPEDASLPVAESPGVATAEFSLPALGFRTPNLFVTERAPSVTDGKLIAAVTEQYDTLPNYGAGAAKVQPLLADWLGAASQRMLNILDHEGQPFEDDALLVAPMHAVDPAVLAPSLVHSLSHAWFRSSHVWLDEGVAQFLSLLWIEQEQGREVAMQHLEQEANTLALAEPVIDRASSASGSEEGQSLIEARDEVYYRTKAAAVLWMLRSIVGDDALKSALHAYREDKQDSDPTEFQRVLEKSAKRELGWFFDDWVYHDKGLPELSITSVTPRALTEKDGKGVSWLVAVEVKNDGGAAAEVPVTVRSGTLTSTQRLRIAGHSTASTRMIFQGVPEEVVMNDGSVPEVTAATHTEQVVVH
jgi:Peptidase family M1 domain